MTKTWRHSDDARREAAAAWVMRLEASDLVETEAVAFDAWLSASPENAAAYDAALAVSHAYAADAGAIARSLSERRIARPVGRRAFFAAGAVAAAAGRARAAAAPACAGAGGAQHT